MIRALDLVLWTLRAVREIPEPSEELVLLTLLAVLHELAR
jgi:hypothetical protein